MSKYPNLSLLLGINEGKGEGLLQLCKKSKVHDSFYGKVHDSFYGKVHDSFYGKVHDTWKCRSLMCLPGYTKRDGFCVLRDATTHISGAGEISIVLQHETEGSRSKERGKDVFYISTNINSRFKMILYSL
ncbi:hypothetical protein NPIL_484651 [Nephila pilipes]|uniref:Uncharacterized protein n=1 Tax=Nephila pilipes TaxID=299642 RepID=A0A8X6PQ34_NEPPI|nr:hypothetical protein NPIL_484651 [Nephila pilipes]